MPCWEQQCGSGTPGEAEVPTAAKTTAAILPLIMQWEYHPATAARGRCTANFEPTTMVFLPQL